MTGDVARAQSSLPVHLAGVTLASPVLAASGCAGTGRELARFADLGSFGAVITRSITPEPRAGLAGTRVAEAPSGLLNAIGLPGPGLEEFVETELPWLIGHGATVIVSLSAVSLADFARSAQRLRSVEGITAIEVNLSNPVADDVAIPFAFDASAAAGVVHAVRRNTASTVPVFAKLAGDVTDVVAIARSCVGAGADGLSLINAVRAVGVGLNPPAAALGATVGGLSGPAIRPIALRAVWQVHEAMPQVPIIGSGGVSSGAEALQMIVAGASAVSVGTALLTNPAAGHRVHAELTDLVAAMGGSLAELVGSAHRVAG